MRMTVATCVMLLELTNNLALLPLMMLVTLVAKVCVPEWVPLCVCYAQAHTSTDCPSTSLMIMLINRCNID